MRAPGTTPTRPAAALAGWLALIAVGTYGFIRHVIASAHGMAMPILVFDPFGLYYPMLDYGFSVLRTGHLPLWNPYQMAGLPFLATFYSGLLYPLNVAYLMLPVSVAMLALTAAHVVLAGLGAALYARVALRVSLIAALAAGVVFMLNTYTLWGFVAQNQLYSLPWIPLLFLAVDRLCATARPIWASALAVAIAMPILGGNLQTLSYEAYAIAPYALACLWRRRRETPATIVRIGVLLAAGVLVGVALSAPQLLPTLELSSISTRSTHGLTPEQIAPLGSPPMPSLRQFLDGSREPFTFLYAGVVVFLLLPFAASSGRRRARTLALTFAAVVMGLVAHGLSNPIGVAYLHLPTGNWFRALDRAWPLTMFCLAALTAIGVEETLVAPRSRGASLLLGGAVVVLAAGLIALAPTPARWLCGAAGTLLLVTRTGLARGRWVRPAAVGLVGILIADFLSSVPVNRTILPFAGEEYHALYVLREAIARAHAERPESRSVHEEQIFNIATTPKLGTLFRIPTFDDDEPFVPPRYRDWGLRMTGDTRVGPSAFYLGGWSLQAPGFDPRFLDYAGVGSIVLLKYNPRQPPSSVAGLAPPTRVAVPSPRSLGARERPMMISSDAYLFTNTHAWPRAFVARQVRVAASAGDALDELATLPRDTAPLAVVESAPDDDLAERDGADGSAVLVESEPERVVIRASAARAAILVLLDTNFPGWHADIDGAETPILQTNYLFRGVRLPAGAHTVTFHYAPRSLRLGLLTGAGGILGMVLMLVTSAGGRARRRVPDRGP